MSLSHASSSSSLLPDMSYTVNRSEIIKCDYTWTIHNFSFYQEDKNVMLKSSLFSAGPREEFKWLLRLFPNGDGEENRGYMSVFLRLQECDRQKITVMFAFSILDAKGKKYNRLKFERPKFERGKDHWGSYGWKRFIAVAALKNKNDALLPNNNLTIQCEISVFDEIVNVSRQQKKMQHANVPPSSLFDDLGSALANKECSDVIFNVSGTKFYAHKVILAARSPVFSKMFKEKANYQRLQLVNLRDTSKDVFEEILQYIYTGKSPRLKELAKGLLVAADKYGLGGLKVLCKEQLCKNLAIENAADFLILADQHEAKKLKIQTLDFILTHMEKVKNTEGFETLARQHPNLLVEALSESAKRLNVTKK